VDPQDERKPDPPREVFLINELIRDYLEFQGYKHTLSVFLPGPLAQSYEPHL
jgi:lisH domain-containing protein FOPNL